MRLYLKGSVNEIVLFRTGNPPATCLGSASRSNLCGVQSKPHQGQKIICILENLCDGASSFHHGRSEREGLNSYVHPERLAPCRQPNQPIVHAQAAPTAAAAPISTPGPCFISVSCLLLLHSALRIPNSKFPLRLRVLAALR